ncbi:hypothetical protein EVG20_g9435 [Dentipellis fragilis]|uniref:Protein-S-isoprenylcysteine O-methyltransferase n=1 Tax=Dentipellis fragilis TaxID=205917 RepID=A0A4Y9XZ99_9AGAM|nr:hypothetical protein EVG20_g9435 [Dentipellis fragilis]
MSSSAYPLLKLPLLFCGSLSVYASMNPPHPMPSKKEMGRYRSDTLSRSLQSRAAVLSTLVPSPQLPYFLNNLAESAMALAYAFPSHPLSRTVLTTVALPASPLRAGGGPCLSLTYLAGLTVLVLGALLRQASFRRLGPLFTYQLSIRDKHHLVTSGPYAHVRHPGYLGATLTFAGIGMCMLGPGALLHDGGWLTTRGGGAMGAAVVLWLGAIGSALLARVPMEDMMMKREFGEEWVKVEKAGAMGGFSGFDPTLGKKVYLWFTGIYETPRSVQFRALGIYARRDKGTNRSPRGRIAGGLSPQESFLKMANACANVVARIAQQGSLKDRCVPIVRYAAALNFTEGDAQVQERDALAAVPVSGNSARYHAPNTPLRSSPTSSTTSQKALPPSHTPSPLHH